MEVLEFFVANDPHVSTWFRDEAPVLRAAMLEELGVALSSRNRSDFEVRMEDVEARRGRTPAGSAEHSRLEALTLMLRCEHERLYRAPDDALLTAREPGKRPAAL